MFKAYFENGTEYDPTDSILITDQGPTLKSTLIRKIEVSEGHVVVRVWCPPKDDPLLGKKVEVAGQKNRASLYMLLNKFYDAMADAYFAKVPKPLGSTPVANSEVFVLESTANELPLFKNPIISVETNMTFVVPRFAFNRKEEIRLTEREKAFKAIRDLREIA